MCPVERVYGFAHRDQVRHEEWGTVGTVWILGPADDPEPDVVTAEVRWHGTHVADELTDQLAAHLTRLDPSNA